MIRRETSAEIDAVAADWAARVDAAPLDGAAQDALDAWLESDTRRLGAYARARAMLAHAGRLQAFGAGFDPTAYKALHQASSPEPVETGVEPAVPLVRRRSFLLGGGAAVAAGVVAAVGFSWQAAATTYATRRGEIRLIPFEDGSSMTLNTASTARVKFTATERRVELVQGEAMFDVARDHARPFVVAAGDMKVRAAATSFTVQRLASRPVQVMVRRGEVEIDRTGLQPMPAQRVTANMRAVSTPTGSEIVMTPLAPTEVSRELAWREGMLSFEDVPLKQAAAEFARYSDTRIAFADPAIGDETVTGLFAANNPVGFAKSVALSLDLKADAHPGDVMLRR